MIEKLDITLISDRRIKEKINELVDKVNEIERLFYPQTSPILQPEQTQKQVESTP